MQHQNQQQLEHHSSLHHTTRITDYWSLFLLCCITRTTSWYYWYYCTKLRCMDFFLCLMLSTMNDEWMEVGWMDDRSHDTTNQTNMHTSSIIFGAIESAKKKVMIHCNDFIKLASISTTTTAASIYIIESLMQW